MAKVTNAKSLATPLAGATLIVTRPVGMGVSMTQRLRALGGKTVNLPGVSIRLVTQAEEAKTALERATGLNGVIFVSPTAVRHAYGLLPQLSFLPSTRVAAMGMTTANALVRRGIPRVIVSSERQDTEGLLAQHEFDSIKNQQWAVIGALGGRELLVQTLQDRGAEVQPIAVYQRLPPRLGPRHFRSVMAARPPMFVFFSSAEVVSNLAQRLPPFAWNKLLSAHAIVSSARLADVVRQQGFERILQARSATVVDLVEAARSLAMT